MLETQIAVGVFHRLFVSLDYIGAEEVDVVLAQEVIADKEVKL